MENLFVLLVLIGVGGFFYFRKRDKRKRNISIGIALISFVLFGVTSPDVEEGYEAGRESATEEAEGSQSDAKEVAEKEEVKKEEQKKEREKREKKEQEEREKKEREEKEKQEEEEKKKKEKEQKEKEQKEEKRKELPKELMDLRITDVRNDKTGNWKKVVSSRNFNMPDNAIGYYEKYMKDDEIHWLVSFATNTTTSIKENLEMLFVTIYEYEEKSEHDAKKINNGMILGEYIVYLDSGEIEDLDEME